MKRKRLKRKYYLIIVLIIIFIITYCIINIFLSSFSFSNDKIRSKIIDNYIDDNINTLVSSLDFENLFTNVVEYSDGMYKSTLFDYKTGQEILLKDILSDDVNFFSKINELIDLKYPKFIADVLKENTGHNTYYFKDYELIIYFYDYEITPAINEDLYLIVNYNEIKDYLKFTPFLSKEYQNEDGSIIDTTKKLIAITFDDGPGAYTTRLIDILSANKARSTFFMLGSNIKKYPGVVKLAYETGQEIAYHSYNHTNFKNQSMDDITRELNTTNNNLESLLGINFKFVRPPYGSINSSIKKTLNMPIILWNVDTQDWRYKDAEYLTKYSLENINDGDIILFHDIHKTSVDAIEALLPELYVRGYCVVTVSELAELSNIKLESDNIYTHFKR